MTAVDVNWIRHALHLQHALPAANVRLALDLPSGSAANEPQRYLVFTLGRARRVGLFDLDPLARRLNWEQLKMLAQGVVADESAARTLAAEFPDGAIIRTPTGHLLLVVEGRDREFDAAIVRDERRWADEREVRP